MSVLYVLFNKVDSWLKQKGIFKTKEKNMCVSGYALKNIRVARLAIYSNLYLFSSQVIFCDGPVSIVCCPLL